MNRTELARIANAMVAKNKGILAADESTGTIGQSPTEATLHLSLMNKLGPLPWNLWLATTGRYSTDQETQAA